MTKKVTTLAITLAMVGGLAGAAFADNAEFQTSFGAFSPNTSALSNNDVLSNNWTDVFNDKSILSHNDDSINNSANTKIKVDDSFNDNSHNTYDSHNDYSDNQAAVGQVNLNDSYAEDINAADNCSTIFDGDVRIGGGGGGWGYGGGNNVNTGILDGSIQGDYSAQFKDVGIGLNNSSATLSSLNSTQTSNINVLNP